LRLHPIQLRVRAEDVVRLRGARERRRYVASQRSARVDPNPHQIDAVIFALERLPEGGCILADEVGLGKTIEAGLVMSQLFAEGARRVLLVAPKPLLGQWRQELVTLFGLDVSEGSVQAGGFDGSGVFVAGRELVGSERGVQALAEAADFDLVVVDEAHEVFAGIYKRFDPWGKYKEDSDTANMAHRLRQTLQRSQSPVLLLTATPIQNSLLELWGLVQYVEPTGTLLGDLRTFRENFCSSEEGTLVPELAEELRERLGQVCQRTLRRQAQEFLERPFVRREARLYEYRMSAEEKRLYDDVTAYLLSPGIAAFRGNARQLLLIGYHRRMASSHRALAVSLQGIEARLKRMAGDAASSASAEVADVAFDMEDEELLSGAEQGGALVGGTVPTAELMAQELARVQDFIARARALGTDSKAQALIRAAQLVLERGARGEGSGKLLIFTESLTTQDYLAELLVEAGVVKREDITLFRGNNDGPHASAALLRWQQEVGDAQLERKRGARDISIRQALVHEFRTRTRVFISTEAGAKGLNLQFCETLVNYDLPWNPQRIEQRIGRCHRYGQQRDVTVINFLAADNEAQRLTFEILSRKLELFGNVLDASDTVLHRAGESSSEALVSAIGPEFERELRRIHERARTLDEQVEELRALREKMEDKRQAYEQTQARTVGLIQTRLDAEVQLAFRTLQRELPEGLAELDRDLCRLTVGGLTSMGVPYTLEGLELRVEAHPALPEALRGGCVVQIGGERLEQCERLHPAHPLVTAAVEVARNQCPGRGAVRFAGNVPEALRGSRGRLAAVLVHYPGVEAVEHLLLVGIITGRDALLHGDETASLMEAEVVDAGADLQVVDDADLDDAIDEAVFEDREPLVSAAQDRYERALGQVERFVEDRVLVLRRQRDQLVERQRGAEARRDQAVGADARSNAEAMLRKAAAELEEVQMTLNRLHARDDEAYQRWRERAYERRFAGPRWERLFDVDFEVT
jgi:hypothetical protein